MSVYYPRFQLVRIAASGVRTPSTATTISAYNVTASSSLGTLVSDSSGYIVEGSFSATADDIVEFTHATYPGKCRFTLNATQAAAYYENLPPSAFVLEDLSPNPRANEVEHWIQDDDNPNTPKQFVGVAAPGETLEVTFEPTVAKNISVYTRSRKAQGGLSQTVFNEDTKETITIPAAVTPGASVQYKDEGSNLGTSGTVTMTNGNMSTLFSFANLRAPQESPITPGKTELELHVNMIAYTSGSTREIILTHDSTA